MKRLLLVLASFLCIAVAACGGNSYGNGSDFSKLKGNGSVALQDPSPSPGAAASLGSNVPGGGGGGNAGPTPQKSSAPPAPPASHFAISITLNSPYFNPPASQVYVGTIITFTNNDSVARNVVSDASDPASFKSGPIAPGASWSYTASVVGTFNYSDGTRPYTPAYFKVLPH